jgi:hypothetical protein
LVTRLNAFRLVAKLLVREEHSYHWELINARRPDQRVYSLVDTIIACQAVKSYSSHELQYVFAGPWRIITAILKDASYELKHCDNWWRHSTYVSLSGGNEDAS